MSFQEYIDQMKSIHQNLIDFLDQMQDEEERFLNIIRSLVDLKKDQHKLKSILYMLVNISNNHHRYPQFFNKIEKILQSLKTDITKYYSNYEIFKIFKSNKLLLLFLIEENIIIVDENIENKIKKIDSKIINHYKFYNNYLFPEKVSNNEIDDNFNEKRRIGENDTLICQLIRQDLISDFITYVNKNDYPLKSEIERSIFETNSFLLRHESITLIEYAVFFGSVQIFKYLYKNGVDLNQRLWLFAVHGDDAEIFQIFEDEELSLTNNYYLNCIEECVKCHNISVLNYIQDNYNNFNKGENKHHVSIYSIHYYNFSCFPKRFDDKSFFNYACKYDNFEIVDYFMKTKQIDIFQFFDGIN